jgi:hypothetical protein
MEFRGARYVHILVTCPLGWGCDSADSVKVARLAAESGFFPVFEGETGDVTSVRKIRRQVPVEAYLKLQRRYAHLFKPERRDDVIDRLRLGRIATSSGLDFLSTGRRPGVLVRTRGRKPRGGNRAKALRHHPRRRLQPR